MLGNGTTPFQGANVIARRTVDPIRDAVSYVSGALFSNTFGGGSDDLALKGQYKITGLPPGNYTVEVEQIDLRRPARLEQVDDTLCSRREVGAFAIAKR